MDNIDCLNVIHPCSLGEFYKKAKTGDVILIRGEEAIESRIIEVGTESIFSHIVFVVRLRKPLTKEPDDNALYVFHATGAIPNCDNLMGLSGEHVQINLSKRFFANYGKGQFVWRRLDDQKAERFAANEQLLLTKIKYYCQFNYELHPMTLVNAYFETRFFFGIVRSCMPNYGRKEKDSYFCSELVAQLYIDYGLLRETAHPTDFLPDWFFFDDGGRLYKTKERLIVKVKK
jgi:hypothetical protein